MSDRQYHHGCPKTSWDKGLEILPPEYKTMAKSCIGKPDLDLMGDKTVQEGWVYFITEKNSKKESIPSVYHQQTTTGSHPETKIFRKKNHGCGSAAL